MDALNIIQTIAIQVRREMEGKYGDQLYGKCIEASERIVSLLREKGLPARTVEGWCIYDQYYSCSDQPFDAHTWVEVNLDRHELVVDVTATQFQAYIDDPIPDVYIGELPRYFQLEKPEDDLWE